MSRILGKFLRVFLRNNLLWKISSPILKVADHIRYQRERALHESSKDLPKPVLFSDLLGEPLVKNGPFRGLRYPSFSSFGSTILPKILGSYESEIHEVVEEICQKNYSEIIDIGSAEGYYAIGLALRIPNAKVFAFDIDEKANEFCRIMAELNGVQERVYVEKRCTDKTLAEFLFTGRGVIVCDCEGYEKNLFNDANINNLSKCDLLIEIHDFIDITISGYIEDLFEATHYIRSIRSLDDITKAKTYRYQEIDHLSISGRKEVLSEGRPAIMEWYYLKAKN